MSGAIALLHDDCRVALYNGLWDARPPGLTHRTSCPGAWPPSVRSG